MYGSAEDNFGRLMHDDLRPFRDELVISSKAGYDMWPGPYGEWGSRKYLLSSLDQSLARMGLEYVDIFYSHRFDPETPLEETMGALHTAVQHGKALYAGISSYSAEKTREAAAILRELGTPLLIHQPTSSRRSTATPRRATSISGSAQAANRSCEELLGGAGDDAVVSAADRRVRIGNLRSVAAVLLDDELVERAHSLPERSTVTHATVLGDPSLGRDP